MIAILILTVIAFVVSLLTTALETTAAAATPITTTTKPTVTTTVDDRAKRLSATVARRHGRQGEGGEQVECADEDPSHVRAQAVHVQAQHHRSHDGGSHPDESGARFGGGEQAALAIGRGGGSFRVRSVGERRLATLRRGHLRDVPAGSDQTPTVRAEAPSVGCCDH